MTVYQNLLTLSLAAAVANGIALSQSGTTATPLTLNGSLVTGGVAKFDVARRVIVTSAGNDSGITFTIVGTDRYGRQQTEVLTGGNGAAVAQTQHDFLTVSSITPSGGTASTVTAGTSVVGSTAPIVMDAYANPQGISVAAIVVSGTPTYTVEICYDDLAPAYDVNTNTPTWFAASGFNAQTTNQFDTVTGPFNLLRLTNNLSSGQVNVKVIQPLGAGML